MAHPQWQLDDKDKITLTGSLDRESVPSLWQSVRKWSPTSEHLDVSLERVERVDSSGMAMLIQLVKHAKNQNCHIMLSFVPEQLNTLFKLSNVQELMADHIRIN
ncbi:lipid asymmetry maintenance protein MlaB [Vibrio sp. S4M6]|uniref:STAS domain-containing protein n=1 Tax=Vibrio sinus TaxID=2946865 RepID=UPI00202A39AB|nr:lipid asymmetry maintenance protein MlaB [Vibrio sinus]MCL9780884.1 lipid asymmetry maintenance protein MlaB [Vibrio sinus]